MAWLRYLLNTNILSEAYRRTAESVCAAEVRGCTRSYLYAKGRSISWIIAI